MAILHNGNNNLNSQVPGYGYAIIRHVMYHTSTETTLCPVRGYFFPSCVGPITNFLRPHGLFISPKVNTTIQYSYNITGMRLLQLGRASTETLFWGGT